MLAGEVHVGEDVVARVLHEPAELGLLLPESIRDGIPLSFGIRLVLLGEDGLQHRGHGRPLLGRGMGERVPHPVNATALVRGVEHPPRSGPQALVIVSDNQLHAAQAPVGERPEEVRPRHVSASEGPVATPFAIGLEHMATQWLTLALAVLVDRDGDYHGPADDPSALAHLHVGRVEPEVGPGSFQRPGEEGVHPLVDFDAEAADLALRHAASTHGLHQIVHGAGGNPVDVCLLE